jgi:hypothetical protein
MANTTTRVVKFEENAMGREKENASIKIPDLLAQMTNILSWNHLNEKEREMVYQFFETISCEENQIVILLTLKALM